MFGLTATSSALALLGLGGYLFWRRYWFFRNPPRQIPPGENIVSPADGTVVYVRQGEPGEPVLSIKRGVPLLLPDLVRQELEHPWLLIGVFMSPFDVHYNRCPIAGRVEFSRHYPPRPVNLAMAPMHWRVLCRRSRRYHHSRHLIQNERVVTKFAGLYQGEPLTCYVVQIAGRRVNRIERFVQVGQRVAKGEIFGLIRFGSQVDLVLNYREGMRVLVTPGQKVKAGETILIR